MTGRKDEMMDIKDVAKQLLDGLDSSDFDYVCERLEQIRIEDALTIEQLNELCWNDSNAMFDRIY